MGPRHTKVVVQQQKELAALQMFFLAGGLSLSLLQVYLMAENPRRGLLKVAASFELRVGSGPRLPNSS